MADTVIHLGGFNNGQTIVATYWEATSSASGTIQIPQGASVLLDSFQGLEDALVSQISSSKPTFDAAVTSGGTRITTTFDTSGNYSLSATPSSYPVAIVWRVTIPENLVDWNNQQLVIEDIERPGGGGSGSITDGTNVGGAAGIFKDALGSDLRFRTLTSNQLTITQDTDTVSINFNSYNPLGW